MEEAFFLLNNLGTEWSIFQSFMIDKVVYILNADFFRLYLYFFLLFLFVFGTVQTKNGKTRASSWLSLA